MKVAVTNHAVDRYRKLVAGASGFYRESIREQIRLIVENGFTEGVLQEHPTEKERNVVPFRSGDTILFLSIGPNTTNVKADISVISVLTNAEATSAKDYGIRKRRSDSFSLR